MQFVKVNRWLSMRDSYGPARVGIFSYSVLWLISLEALLCRSPAEKMGWELTRLVIDLDYYVIFRSERESP
jgi:hypothetical protein